jgi:hypothetical protein
MVEACGMKTDDEIVREIADRIYDSFAETPQWTRQGWAAKLSPHIREGISEVRKPLVGLLREFVDDYNNPLRDHAVADKAKKLLDALAKVKP